MRRLLPVFFAASVLAAEPSAAPRGNRLLADYFAREVAEIENTPIALPASAEDWEKTRRNWRAQLADMLGLNPMPEKTPLNTVKTGEFTEDGIVVEKLHFQSLPGLYVTANLYRPAPSAQAEGQKFPAILYVCGHSNMNGKDGTSLGNKAGYEHHGAWYARRGFVCLVIDTVELGEIRGEHHGTYSKGRWWWMSRGYTPAGLEAWSGIRALDYLEARPEVDMARVGVNGRSGGGAYSWYTAALDDRIKVVVPTAGITTLRNHVVDGCVEGHCDCMYMVNAQRWDYDKVAALIAPRPLLIANTDKDTIFPLDGVMAVYNSARRIYKALGAEGKIGLQIAEGPHKDTQALNTGEFAWMERQLKGLDAGALFDGAAKKTIDPEKLRVFSGLPGDERNTRIDEDFVPAAKAPEIPKDAAAMEKLRASLLGQLKAKSFAGWPKVAPDLALREAGMAEHEGVVMRAWDFTPQEPWDLRLYVAHSADLPPATLQSIVLNVLDQKGWVDFRNAMGKGFATLFEDAGRNAATGDGFNALRERMQKQRWAAAWVAPRGMGPTAWTGSEKQQTQRLRRFYLLGQTLDGMQVWDIRRAIAALREAGFARQELWLEGSGTMAANALYAALFEERVAGLELREPPSTHAKGPTYLNVLRVLDMPQAVAIAGTRSKVRIFTRDEDAWAWAQRAAEKRAAPEAFELRLLREGE